MKETGFRYLEHVADAVFLAWAPTLTGAFEQAALAMINLVCDPATVRDVSEYPLEVGAENEGDLLFAFLAEILFIQDSQGILIGTVRITSMESGEGELMLKATVHGEPYDETRHVLLGGVKAPTYHELAVNHLQGSVEIRVLVDT